MTYKKKKQKKNILAMLFSLLAILYIGSVPGFIWALTGTVRSIQGLSKKSRKKKLCPMALTLSLIGLSVSLYQIATPDNLLSPIIESKDSFIEDIDFFSLLPQEEQEKLETLTYSVKQFYSSWKQTPATGHGDGDETTLHFLDVGQGLSILIESNGHFMLYDGGDRSTSSFVVAYLKEAGVTKLDYVIASHYDADHINGLVGALTVFDCDYFIGPGYQGTSKVYQSLMNVIEEKNIPFLSPEVGKAYEFASSSFQILAPGNSSYQTINNYSIAIMFQNGNDRIFITGDAEMNSEAEMCNQNDLNLSCDLYVAGHHGSASSSSWDLLQQALPSSVLISSGADNSYGHPHADTMERFEALELDGLYRTDLQGTLLAYSSGNGITWSQAPCNDYTPGE